MSNDILWGKTGHRVVAEVASKYISKNTRTSLDKFWKAKALLMSQLMLMKLNQIKNIPSIMHGTMQILI